MECITQPRCGAMWVDEEKEMTAEKRSLFRT